MRKSRKILSIIALLSGSAFLFFYEKQDDTEQLDSTLTPISESKPDTATITDTRTKKKTFFDYLRPGVEIENARVQKERKRLLDMKTALQQENSLSSEQIETAKRLGRLYSLEPTEVTLEWLEDMLHRSMSFLKLLYLLKRQMNQLGALLDLLKRPIITLVSGAIAKVVGWFLYKEVKVKHTKLQSLIPRKGQFMVTL